MLVKLRTPRGVQWVSTGTTSYQQAREVCTEAMVAELQMAASANALTADVISRLTTGRRFTMADIQKAWRGEASMDLAADTLANYDGVLSDFIAREKCATMPLSAVTRRQLYAFVNDAKATVSTRRGRLAALRSFYNFASAAGYCVGNLAARVQVSTRDLLFEQIERRESIPITEIEYTMLMHSPRVSPFWRTATALGYWLGYRLRDVACLEWKSIRRDKIVIFMRKTRKRLELDLTDPLLGSGELKRVFSDLLAQPANGSPYCFPKEQDMASVSTRRAGLSVYYQRVLQRHKIEGKHFHCLRHACATRLKAAGWSNEEVRDVLGHSSVETTKIYSEHEAEA